MGRRRSKRSLHRRTGQAWEVLDGPELDGPEIFWKRLPKSIDEIWKVFKFINKLPNNYKKNTNCTAKRCIWYWNCNYWVTCWWVWKLSKFHWYFLAIFFKKSQAHLAQAHLELSKYCFSSQSFKCSNIVASSWAVHGDSFLKITFDRSPRASSSFWRAKSKA